MAEHKENWFSEWFNTKYYHILYQNRNDEEAQVFIKNLFDFLDVKENAFVLDAACGSGRHSVMVNNLGFKVLGVDLSDESILKANESKTASLSFEVADLREFKSEKAFDLVLNLFTSFGYFSHQEENLQVLRNFHMSLNEEGMLVLDFMNAYKVKKNLVPSETKVLDKIQFNITRKVEEKTIVKSIDFKDETGDQRSYQERVDGFELEDFKTMLTNTDFEICHIFGDYFLNEFNRESSPRLILLAKPV